MNYGDSENLKSSWSREQTSQMPCALIEIVAAQPIKAQQGIYASVK